MESPEERSAARAGLPPGQRRRARLPRFGTHAHLPPPSVPPEPTIELQLFGRPAGSVPVTRLGDLPRVRVVADFHCVAGWSVTDLDWEGVAFTDFWREVVDPLAQRDDPPATHLTLVGLDGYRCVVDLRDVLDGRALLADHLDGRPLSRNLGAPVRFVSPEQYGFVSTKHLSAIEVHDGDPGENFGTASRLARAVMRKPLFARHPRSRVWSEERSSALPNWAVRPFYRAISPAIAALCWCGRDDDRPTSQETSRA